MTCLVISSVFRYIFEKQLQSDQAKQQVSSTLGEALCSLQQKLRQTYTQVDVSFQAKVTINNFIPHPRP